LELPRLVKNAMENKCWKEKERDGTHAFMVEIIYAQAFRRRFTKIKLMASYHPFRCA
jgi:hypothetical protein